MTILHLQIIGPPYMMHTLHRSKYSFKLATNESMKAEYHMSNEDKYMYKHYCESLLKKGKITGLFFFLNLFIN